MRITDKLVTAVEDKFKGHVTAITAEKVAIKVDNPTFKRHSYITTKVEVDEDSGAITFYNTTYDLSVGGCADNMLSRI